MRTPAALPLAAGHAARTSAAVGSADTTSGGAATTCSKNLSTSPAPPVGGGPADPVASPRRLPPTASAVSAASAASAAAMAAAVASATAAARKTTRNVTVTPGRRTPAAGETAYRPGAVACRRYNSIGAAGADVTSRDVATRVDVGGEGTRNSSDVGSTVTWASMTGAAEACSHGGPHREMKEEQEGKTKHRVWRSGRRQGRGRRKGCRHGVKGRQVIRDGAGRRGGVSASYVSGPLGKRRAAPVVAAAAAATVGGREGRERAPRSREAQWRGGGDAEGRGAPLRTPSAATSPPLPLPPAPPLDGSCGPHLARHQWGLPAAPRRAYRWVHPHRSGLRSSGFAALRPVGRRPLPCNSSNFPLVLLVDLSIDLPSLLRKRGGYLHIIGGSREKIQTIASVQTA